MIFVFKRKEKKKESKERKIFTKVLQSKRRAYLFRSPSNVNVRFLFRAGGRNNGSGFLFCFENGE